MKVVIFAGGLGTRISEETDARPKPMVEIGGKPILWHIMKIYSQYGFNDFIICLGYKGYIIKEYFMHYFIHNSDITIELGSNKVEVHGSNTESFKVTLVDTGVNTKTAGRLKQVKKYLDNEDFMLTYGDGVSDINLKELLAFHKSHKKLPPLRQYNWIHALEEWMYRIMEELVPSEKKQKTKVNGSMVVFLF